MITFINEELFSTVCEKKEGKDGRPDFFRTIIQSSMNVIDKKNPDSVAPKVIEHVLHTAEDNLNKENTRVGVKFMNGRGFVRLNQKESNKYDTPVFFIAIPYNGFVVPVQRSKSFQIYKGFTVTVNDPINFGGDTYKHVAYLMLVPNRKVLEDEETPCEFVMESFSTRKDNDTQKTIKTTCTVEFYLRNDEHCFMVLTNQEETDPVNVSDYSGKRTFPIVNFKKNGGKKPDANAKEEGEAKREEKPKVNKARTPVDHLTHRATTKSLDDMLKDADLNEAKPSRKKNKNKRKKKRR